MKENENMGEKDKENPTRDMKKMYQVRIQHRVIRNRQTDGFLKLNNAVFKHSLRSIFTLFSYYYKLFCNSADIQSQDLDGDLYRNKTGNH